jgi:carbon storage regulator
MLILSRKSGEQLVIGDGIRVTVRCVNRRRVSLAIEAPRSMRIRREEGPGDVPDSDDGRGSRSRRLAARSGASTVAR